MVTVPFNSINEYVECYQIIKNIQTTTNNDCFITGDCHKYLQSRITNKDLLNYKKNNKYNISYQHIKQFYDEIGLDLSIYVEYFKIGTTVLNNINDLNDLNYKIIFLHTQGSNRQIDLSNIINKYNNQNDYIIICANKNAYNPDNPKYFIANKYINIKVAYYIDIMKSATELHLINSCFSCIAIPLILSNEIKNCIIYE